MDTSKAIRGVVGSGAIAALLSQLAQLHTWGEVLAFIAGGGGGGVLTFAIVEGADAIKKGRDGQGQGLNPDLKFWGAVVIAMASTIIAVGVEVYLKLLPLTPETVAATAATVYTLSQAIHWEFGSQAHDAVHPPSGA